MEVWKRVAQLHAQVVLEVLPLELNRSRHGLSPWQAIILTDTWLACFLAPLQHLDFPFLACTLSGNKKPVLGLKTLVSQWAPDVWSLDTALLSWTMHFKKQDLGMFSTCQNIVSWKMSLENLWCTYVIWESKTQRCRNRQFIKNRWAEEQNCSSE